MTKKALIDVQADGLVPGLTVVGFHGAMAGDETPAKLGPVYANAAGCLTRIVEVGPTRATPIHKVRVESFEPPLRNGEPLPGNGTRIGPWSARFGSIVMAIGPHERRKLAELRRYASTHGTPSVQRFIKWFANHELRSEDLQCELQDEIALWYCTPDDGFTLLKCVHHVVKEAFFAAVRSQSSADMEETAWWLSRAPTILGQHRAWNRARKQADQSRARPLAGPLAEGPLADARGSGPLADARGSIT